MGIPSSQLNRLLPSAAGQKVKADVSKSLRLARAVKERWSELCVLETEVKFCPNRKWRWDLVAPGWKLAVEINGAIWTGGGHSRGSGMIRDYEKYCSGAALGWRILFVTPSQCEPGGYLDQMLTYITQNYDGTLPLPRLPKSKRAMLREAIRKSSKKATASPIASC